MNAKKTLCLRAEWIGSGLLRYCTILHLVAVFSIVLDNHRDVAD